MLTGRKKDPLWQHFTQLQGNEKTIRAECKYCKKNLVGLIARMRVHLKTQCTAYLSTESGASTSGGRNHDDVEDLIELADESDDVEPNAKRPKKEVMSLSNVMSQFVVKTSEKEKQKIDTQIAKYFYATNSAFRHVEHPEFIKLLKIVRPGYTPPNRKLIGGKFIDDVHRDVEKEMENDLKGKVVCMALDGWSNIHNEPIVCVSATTTDDGGRVHLIDTIDTADNSHTGDYLLHLAVDSIKKCQNFGCYVRSFVTDNAANMAKMRRQLAKREDSQIGDIITYGCSAHILHLFAKDIQQQDLKSRVKNIIKYFKYHHFPGAKYKEAGGKKLTLPQDVRWNTLADCLESYVSNWHYLAKVCSEHRAVLDLSVVREVQDIELKENVENYFKKLKKVAIALDHIQKDICVLSESVYIWKSLFSLDWSSEERSKLKGRYDLAMTPAHFAAFILDPKYKDEELSEEEDTSGMEFIDSRSPQAMKDMLMYRAMAYPFKEYMFKEELLQKTHVSLWWKSLEKKIHSETTELTTQLFTATASSAGIERLFSTFGLVHSKLRNRLGTEKAAKLVAIMTALNRNQTKEMSDEMSE